MKKRILFSKMNILSFVYFAVLLPLCYWVLMQNGVGVPTIVSSELPYLYLFFLLAALAAIAKYPMLSYLFSFGAVILFSFFYHGFIFCFLSPWLLMLTLFKSVRNKSASGTAGMILSVVSLIIPLIFFIKNLLYAESGAYAVGEDPSVIRYYAADVLLSLFFIFCLIMSFRIKTDGKPRKKAKGEPKKSTPQDFSGDGYHTFYLLCAVISVCGTVYGIAYHANDYLGTLFYIQFFVLVACFLSGDPVLTGLVKKIFVSDRR